MRRSPAYVLPLLVVLAPSLGRRGWAGAAAGLAAFGLLGLARLWPAEPEPEPVALILVQGNVAQTLSSMGGLQVDRVDVTVEQLSTVAKDTKRIR